MFIFLFISPLLTSSSPLVRPRLVASPPHQTSPRRDLATPLDPLIVSLPHKKVPRGKLNTPYLPLPSPHYPHCHLYIPPQKSATEGKFIPPYAYPIPLAHHYSLPYQHTLTPRNPHIAEQTHRTKRHTHTHTTTIRHIKKRVAVSLRTTNSNTTTLTPASQERITTRQENYETNTTYSRH
jgi:hypothetical protein